MINSQLNIFPQPLKQHVFALHLQTQRFSLWDMNNITPIQSGRSAHRVKGHSAPCTLQTEISSLPCSHASNEVVGQPAA